jgi:hypothetical protein
MLVILRHCDRKYLDEELLRGSLSWLRSSHSKGAEDLSRPATLSRAVWFVSTVNY